VPSDVQLFVENGGGERGGEHGAERGEHGGVERAPHRDAPRLQVQDRTNKIFGKRSSRDCSRLLWRVVYHPTASPPAPSSPAMMSLSKVHTL